MNALSRRLLAWYRRHGRAHLPWRATRDPYRILVSEAMLQQTQVDRVLPKYDAFIERFPTFEALAGAPAADVIRMWKGLGYNSRAVRLHRTAKTVVERHGGTMPTDERALRDLPGLGPYTVAAVRAFAFDLRAVAADTNVRRVLHRVLHGIEYPPRANGAALDAQALALVPQSRAHDWNSAMMDLGASICTARAPKCLLCPLQQICVAAPIDRVRLETLRKTHARAKPPQTALPFERSTRFARGRVVDELRSLPPGERISLLDLHAAVRESIQRTSDEVEAIVAALERDGIVHVQAGKVALAQ